MVLWECLQRGLWNRGILRDERPAGRCLPHRSWRSREEVKGTWEGPVGHSLPLCREDDSLWLHGPSNNGQERTKIDSPFKNIYDSSTPDVFHSFKCQSHGPGELFNLRHVASQQDMSHSAAVVPTFIQGGFVGKEGERACLGNHKDGQPQQCSVSSKSGNQDSFPRNLENLHMGVGILVHSTPASVKNTASNLTRLHLLYIRQMDI